MIFAEMDHILEKKEDILVFFKKGPVEPGDLIVLTVRIVVAELSITKFISCKKHRGSPAAHQYSAGILDHLHAKGEDIGVICISFSAAVPAAVVVGAVCIIPSVCLIMFFIVSVKIIQCKAIMAGEEIDRCVGASDFRIVNIRGTGNSAKSCRCVFNLSFQEISHIVPVTSVPLTPSPERRKISHLIETACIPGFCNQFCISKYRIKGKALKKGRMFHGRTIFISPQDGGKIKAKAINPVGSHPIPEAALDHLLYNRVITVHGISAPAEIVIAAFRSEHVINIVVKSFE